MPEVEPEDVLVEVGALRDLRQQRPRHGRQHGPPPPADHHGARGGRYDRQPGTRRARLGRGRPGDLRLHDLLRQVPLLPGRQDQPLQPPPRAGSLLRGLPPARRLRPIRGRPPAHPLPPAGGSEFRAGGHGRAPLDRAARHTPHATTSERYGPGGRCGDDWAFGAPGVAARPAAERRSSWTSIRRGWSWPGGWARTSACGRTKATWSARSSPEPMDAGRTWQSKPSGSHPPCNWRWPVFPRAGNSRWWATSRRIELPLQAVVSRELTLHGSCASCGEYPTCLELMARGTINVDSLVSAHGPLGGGRTWFERLHRGGQGLMKVILQPNASATLFWR